MADPGPKKRRATYQEVLAAPEHLIAEIVDGVLFMSPRPGRRHGIAATNLVCALGPTFGGAGGDHDAGWFFVVEPELHFGEDIVVPDIGGWRRDRDLVEPNEAFFIVAPDWVCEVLSPSTERLDRTRKLGVYARAGVRHAWLLNPLYRSLEVLRLHEGEWIPVATHIGNALVRAVPFDAIVLDLSSVWRDVPPPPSLASEPSAGYHP